MPISPVDADAISERLESAKIRMEDLLALNGGDLPGADVATRQRLIQEFFFHLLGSLDVLAQYVNEQRKLGLDEEDVTLGRIHLVLPISDSLGVALRALYVKTRGQPLPQNPYDDHGYLFRAFNYRHHVTHRRRNPFLFRVGAQPSASLLLDPRIEAGQGPNHSVQSVGDDLSAMLNSVHSGVASALSAL